MKTRSLFNPAALLMLLVGIVTFGLAGCKEREPVMPTLPVLKIWHNGELVPTTGYKVDINRQPDSTFTILIESSRDWDITKPASANWITLSRTSGPADATTPVTITVAANDGLIRSAVLTATARDGSRTATFGIAQAGDLPDIDATPIADFRAEYATQVAAAPGQSLALPQGYTFAGTVVSDLANQNFTNGTVIVQDGTTPGSGITFRNFDTPVPLVGDYVVVTVNTGATASLFNGVLQVIAAKVETIAQTIPEYATVTVAQILDYESQLIKIENVQSISDAVRQWAPTSNTTTDFEQEGDLSKFGVYVRTAASFARENVETGSGYIIGVSGRFNDIIQVSPRSLDDLQFLAGERFPGSGGGGGDKEGANIILQENMGSTNVPSNTNVNTWNTTASPSGFQRAGLGAAAVVYSTPTATGTNDTSVRTSSGSGTSYEKASGGNNVFFGAPTQNDPQPPDPVFLISNINLGGTNELYLGFGLQTSSNNLTVEYSEDGGAWQTLMLTSKTSTSWGYLITPFNVTEGTVQLSIRFTGARFGSGFRIDDIYLTTDQTYSEVAIPTVTTNSSDVSNKDVVLTGSVSYSGNPADITEMGFEYGEDHGTAPDMIVVPVPSATLGTFLTTIVDLAPAIYQWNAYAKKGDVVFRGETMTFIIEPDNMTTLKIADIVAAWVNDATIGVGNQIIGTIVSDKTGQNYSAPDNSFFIVDDTATNSGMFIYQLKEADGTTNAVHSFAAGTQVVVDVSGATMATFNGLRQLTGIKLSAVSTDVPVGTPSYSDPLAISSDEMSSYQSMLVRIASQPAQSAIGQTWNGTRAFTDTGSEAPFNTNTRSQAPFSTAIIPAASGTLTGIVGSYNAPQLLIRNAADIALTTPIPWLTVTPSSLTFIAEGEAKTLAVTATVPAGYTLNLDHLEGWYTAEFNVDKTEITVTATPNAGAERLGSLKVYMLDNASQEVTAITKNIPIDQLASGMGIPFTAQWNMQGRGAWANVMPYTSLTAGSTAQIGDLTPTNFEAGSTAAAHSWGGVNFVGNDPSNPARYATFTVSSPGGSTFSLTSLSGNIRRSNTGPIGTILQYKIGDGSYVDIINWDNLSGTAAGGNPVSADLSTVAELQDVAGGTVVTIRFIPNPTNTNIASGGTWYLNGDANGTIIGLQVVGEVK